MHRSIRLHTDTDAYKVDNIWIASKKSLPERSHGYVNYSKNNSENPVTGKHLAKMYLFLLINHILTEHTHFKPWSTEANKEVVSRGTADTWVAIRKC